MPRQPHRRRKPNSPRAKARAGHRDRVTTEDGRKLRRQRAVDELRALETEQEMREGFDGLSAAHVHFPEGVGE